MQFRAFGRLSVISRIEGVGKLIRESWTGGGGIIKLVIFAEGGWDCEGVWKIRTGQAVWERV
jgi:hypothetical protein